MSKTPITDAFADQRAEIARLTAELAAARAVPADVEALAGPWADGYDEGRADAMRRPEDRKKPSTRDSSINYGKATIASAIAEARQPATAGGLLATGTVRDLLGALPVVEWFDAPDWHQARIVQHGSGSVKGAEMRWRHERAASWASWRIVAGVAWRSHMVKPARLVPASEADADPMATRGPLPKGG